MKRQIQVFGYSIKNQSATSVDVYIDGQIVDAESQQIMRDWWGDESSVSYKSFRDQLTSIDASVINVYINSPGGLVTDAMAMHDLLVDMRSKGKKVNTVGRGIIASAATYILMAGDSPRMSKNSWFMIHNVSGAIWGDVEAIESYAASMRKFNDRIRDFYSESTGLRKEDISKMMNAETWLNADEAKEKGFIKEVEGEAKFTNRIQPDNWHYQNFTVLNAYNAATAAPEPEKSSQNQIEDMKKFFKDLGDSILNAIKGVKAPENNDHATLMNSIAEAVGNQISQASESVDAAVSEAVTNAINSQLSQAVTNAVTEAVKPLNTKIEDLEKSKGELEADITALKGKASHQDGNNNEPPKQFGSFKK